MTIDAAVDVIARQALAEARVRIDWEDYPEIGERDWERIKHRMHDLAPPPGAAVFVDAYALLAGRTDE